MGGVNEIRQVLAVVADMQSRIFTKLTAALAALAVVVLLAYWLWSISTTPPPSTNERVAARATEQALPAVPSGSPLSRSSVGAEKYPIEADRTALVPMRYRMPGVERVRTASSFQDWLGQFPADVQEKMKAFSKRNFGVYSIDSPQQIAWMAAHGYPLPEDLVAADKLSNADLRELANQGNDKAGFLLRERNIDVLKAKFADYAAKGLSRQRFWETDPDGPSMEQEDKNDRALMMKSWSPFKGYLQAQDSLLQQGDVSSSPHDAEAKIMAGLALAGYLGDTRADQFALAYVGDDPIRQAIYTALQNATSNQGLLVRATLNAGCAPVSSDGIPQ